MQTQRSLCQQERYIALEHGGHKQMSKLARTEEGKTAVAVGSSSVTKRQKVEEGLFFVAQTGKKS